MRQMLVRVYLMVGSYATQWNLLPENYEISFAHRMDVVMLISHLWLKKIPSFLDFFDF